jgi:hypothetical protein
VAVDDAVLSAVNIDLVLLLLLDVLLRYGYRWHTMVFPPMTFLDCASDRQLWKSILHARRRS